jgi:hypothetical protein
MLGCEVAGQVVFSSRTGPRAESNDKDPAQVLPDFAAQRQSVDCVKASAAKEAYLIT